MTIEEMKKNGTMDKYFQESFIKYVEEKNIGKEKIDLYSEEYMEKRKEWRDSIAQEAIKKYNVKVE